MGCILLALAVHFHDLGITIRALLVLTFFFMTAPVAAHMIGRAAYLVGVPLWEHVLAVVLVLATIYALVRFAGRVYAHGLLRGGPGLGARAAWRLARQP